MWFLFHCAETHLQSFLNMEIDGKPELYLQPFYASFLVLLSYFFFTEVEGMMIGGAKEPKPHKTLEMRMLPDFIQFYDYVFSLLLLFS